VQVQIHIEMYDSTWLVGFINY